MKDNWAKILVATSWKVNNEKAVWNAVTMNNHSVGLSHTCRQNICETSVTRPKVEILQ